MPSLILNPKPVPQILGAKVRMRRQRGRKTPLRLRRPPRQRLPIGIERELRAEYLRALDKARDLITQLLIPRLPEIEGRAALTFDAMRADVESWPETLGRIFDEIRGRFDPVLSTLESQAAGASRGVSALNKAQVGRQMRSALGVDVLVAEPRLGDMLAASTAENVGLIKSVPANFFDDVEQTILRQFRTGQRAADIAPEIAKRFGVAQSRAAFIARDQMSKLNGDLTRMRQVELGIPGYIWRTSLDERVRGSDDGTSFGPRSGAHDHARLEGTRQTWDKPPIVDQDSGRRAHPGGDFNCR